MPPPPAPNCLTVPMLQSGRLDGGLGHSPSSNKDMHLSGVGSEQWGSHSDDRLGVLSATAALTTAQASGLHDRGLFSHILENIQASGFL